MRFTYWQFLFRFAIGLVAFLGIAAENCAIIAPGARKNRDTVSNSNELTLDIEMLPDGAIVRCRGALSLTTAGRLRHEVKLLMQNVRVVTVDFTDLSLIDSIGIGTMASLYVSSKNAGRELLVVNIGPRVREMFSVTRLLSLFEAAGEANVRLP